MRLVWVGLAAAVLIVGSGIGAGPAGFRFVVLGDRTGETVPGVYEGAWREAATAHPDFVVSVGDTIQGLNDATAEREWRQVRQVLDRYARFPFYAAPGNHDVWSGRSAELYRKFLRRSLHYGFDYGPAHFTVLDNSRSDEFAAEEMTFLEKDLAAHAKQPVKFVISHRPSWLMHAVLQNPDFRLHQLAKQYGIRYVIAGHVHQMLRFDLEGVRYLSMASSGGHLRASRRYEDGWFFGYGVVDVRGSEIRIQIRELGKPYGQGRRSEPGNWGAVGLK